jgi:hypothetical protein
MSRFFHVTSALNRESILAHGLDWTRMGAAPGIAGSHEPEEDGVFLSGSEFDARWFVAMNNTGGPVDVWAVDGIDPEQLVTTQSGYDYFPGRIPSERLALVDLPPDPSAPHDVDTSSGAFQSHLTITLDDGTVLSDEETRKFVEDARQGNSDGP